MRSSKKPKWFVPRWEGLIEGYVMNTIPKNFFRVEVMMTREDYIQEAYVVFLRVKNKYEGQIKADEPQHFTALFKRAWANRLNDLSNEATSIREHFVPDHNEDSSGTHRESLSVGETDNEGALAVLIRQAPREVAMVLNLFLNAPQEILDVALEPWRGKDRRFAGGGSARICQLLGLDPNVDVMQRVEDYFVANS